MLDHQTIAAAVIIFAAALTRSTFGFGEALVAMPLLSMIMDVKAAAAVVGLTLIVNSIMNLVTTTWRDIEWDAAWRLGLMAVIGVPIGVNALVSFDPHVVKLFLAVLVIAFALYNLMQPRLVHLKNNRPAFAFGLVAGILGGAYNTFGPPLVIFGTLRDWGARRFRATLPAVFLPIGLIVAVTHASHGLWKPPIVFRCLLVGLPGLAIAALLGRELNRRLAGPRFARYVCILLLVIGAMLVINIARDAIMAADDLAFAADS